MILFNLAATKVSTNSYLYCTSVLFIYYLLVCLLLYFYFLKVCLFNQTFFSYYCLKYLLSDILLESPKAKFIVLHKLLLTYSSSNCIVAQNVIGFLSLFKSTFPFITEVFFYASKLFLIFITNWFEIVLLLKFLCIVLFKLFASYSGSYCRCFFTTNDMKLISCFLL